ncbi:protein lozenge-like [Thrips palmi]|uniref:Protein lozenge-like n=1 Tax=Thrips palmi TaxID=161013 RepID=A0A6P8ZMT0_THRPL|nr:protein lozenge-like [Thrips palmi]
MVLYPNLYSTVNQNQIHLHLHHNPTGGELSALSSAAKAVGVDVGQVTHQVHHHQVQHYDDVPVRAIEIGIDLQQQEPSNVLAGSLAEAGDDQAEISRYPQHGQHAQHDSRQTDPSVWRPY